MTETIIRDYRESDRDDFRDLNVAWISRFFKMEEADTIALENPQVSILDRGGHIFVASHAQQTLGVCALLKRDDERYPFELAKMAVSEEARGQGLGVRLGNAVIQKAKELGAKTLYLESNTSLVPAINLYRKLGFEEVTGLATPYERCNIQMEKIL